MKKVKIILLIIGVILLSGCNKTYTCIYEDKTNNNYESIITYKIKNNIVVNARAEMTYKDTQTASYMCEVFQYANDANDTLKCDGKKIVIDDYQKSVREENMTQKEFVTYLEQQKFKCID